MTCDTLIIVGTSLTVYPAAGFIRYFRGKNLVVINKQETNSCFFLRIERQPVPAEGMVGLGKPRWTRIHRQWLLQQTAGIATGCRRGL